MILQLAYLSCCLIVSKFCSWKRGIQVNGTDVRIRHHTSPNHTCAKMKKSLWLGGGREEGWKHQQPDSSFINKRTVHRVKLCASLLSNSIKCAYLIVCATHILPTRIAIINRISQVMHLAAFIVRYALVAFFCLQIYKYVCVDRTPSPYFVEIPLCSSLLFFSSQLHLCAPAWLVSRMQTRGYACETVSFSQLYVVQKYTLSGSWVKNCAS